MRIDSAIITGSFSVNGDTFNDLGSYSTTGSNTFVGNQSIVGAVSASAFTGSISYTNLTNVPTLISGSEQIVGILSSLNSFTASNSTTNTFTSSASARLNSIETITASNVARLTSLEAITGSLATTGSNTFIGTQTITGSLYISSDLIVQGSSSLQNITASAVSIGTNIINLNTANPAIRYAGLSIGDSGSIGSSGSFLYDSVQDEFIFVHRGANTTVTSSVLLMGPQTYDSIGNETYLTSNRIPKGAGNEHLADSNISDTGTLVSINSATASFSGSVGIGRTAPEFTLDVNGDIALNRTNKLMFAGGVVGDRSRSHITGDGNNNLFIYGPSNNLIATFAYGGNVGIGITNPGKMLEIKDTSSNNTAQLKLSDNSGAAKVYLGNFSDSAYLTSGGTYASGWVYDSASRGVGNIVVQSIDGGSAIELATSNTNAASPTARLNITKDGYIGIGTNAPDIRFVLRAAAANVSVMAIRSTTNNNLFNFISNDTTGQSIFDMGKNTESGTFVGGYIRLRSDGNSWIQGGNLGVRTITPQQPLHVDQGAVASVNLGVPGTSGTTQRGIVRLTPGQGVYGETLDIGMNVGPTYAWLQSTNTADLAVKYSLILNPNGGNVGIGTTNPLAKLEIKSSGDGDLFIARYSGGAAKLIYGYQSSADGYLELRTGADSTITRLSGYSGTSSYFLSNVGIGITNPGTNTLFVYGNLCVQSGGAYGLIKGYDDFYHGLICRGYPTTATNLTDITASDVMSFYEYGGDYRFYTKNPSSLTQHIRFYLGTIYATNTTVQSVSDIRTKENIRNSSEGLSVIDALRPVRFDFKDGFNESKKNQLGFIAQEVEEVFPDAVSEWTKDDGETYKTMGPSALIPVLVKAIQELKAEIEILKNK